MQVRSRSQAAQEELDLDRPNFLPAGMPAAVAKATRNPYDARPSLPQRRMFRPPRPSVKGQVPEGTAAGKAAAIGQSQAQGLPPAAAAEQPQQIDAAPQYSPPQAACVAPPTETEAAPAASARPPAQAVDELRLPQPGPIGQTVDETQPPQQGPPVQAEPTVHGAAPLRPEPWSASAGSEGDAGTGVKDANKLDSAEAVNQKPETESDWPRGVAEANDAQAGAGATQLGEELNEGHVAARGAQVSEAAGKATSKDSVAPDELEQTPESVSLLPDTQTHPSDQ